MKYAAVIAAAGLSSRMHEFKPMLCLGERTMIESVICNLKDAGVDNIVVVTGYRSELLRKHLSTFGVESVENEDFAKTKMFDSLCLGLRALKTPYDAVFLMPGDVPLVRPETIEKMKTKNAPIVRPVCNGKYGHPVMIKESLIPEVLSYDGKGGLRGCMERICGEILDMEIDDIGITMDADTPEDFKALRYRKMENQSSGRLWPEIQIHISKNDTVLTPETAQFVEMIGHTGSIQTACACMHMSYSKGWKLLNKIEKELGFTLVCRHQGGSNGGGSTLTEKGERLLSAYQCYRDKIRKDAEVLFAEIFSEDFN